MAEIISRVLEFGSAHGLFIVLLGISLTGGFFSGLMGVGGAVVLIPMLLMVPPLFGVEELSMNEVAGITMLQVLYASIVGLLAHRRGGHAHLPTSMAIGVPMGAMAFLGALMSGKLDSRQLEIVFGVIVLVALVLLFRRRQGEDSHSSPDFTFNWWASALCGAVIGAFTGMIGAGGGFILVPVMTGVLGLPMRVAIGSSLGSLFLAAIFGSAGKIMAKQVPWEHLAPILLGSIPAALLGAKVSGALSPRTLRLLLVVMLALIAFNTWRHILV